jgi:hypothetical protein
VTTSRCAGVADAVFECVQAIMGLALAAWWTHYVHLYISRCVRTIGRQNSGPRCMWHPRGVITLGRTSTSAWQVTSARCQQKHMRLHDLLNVLVKCFSDVTVHATDTCSCELADTRDRSMAGVAKHSSAVLLIICGAINALLSKIGAPCGFERLTVHIQLN